MHSPRDRLGKHQAKIRGTNGALVCSNVGRTWSRDQMGRCSNGCSLRACWQKNKGELLYGAGPGAGVRPSAGLGAVWHLAMEQLAKRKAPI